MLFRIPITGALWVAVRRLRSGRVCWSGRYAGCAVALARLSVIYPLRLANSLASVLFLVVFIVNTPSGGISYGSFLSSVSAFSSLRSKMRSFALRDLVFLLCSSSEGRIGFFVITVPKDLR